MTVPLVDVEACNVTVQASLPSWQTSSLQDTNLCTGAGPKGITAACSVSAAVTCSTPVTLVAGAVTLTARHASRGVAG